MNGKRRTHNEFIKEVYDLVGDEYIVLTKFIAVNKKILMRHNKCGNNFEVAPVKFLGNQNTKGTRCSHCFQNKKKTTMQFKTEIYKLVGNDYEVLSEYEGSNTYIKMRHIKCNFEYSIKPKHFLYSNVRCLYCNGNMKKMDTEIFKNKIYDLVKDEYVVLSEYINANAKILMKHNINTCLFEWEITPNSFLNNNARCPKCAGNYHKDTEYFKKEIYNLVKDEYYLIDEYVNNITKIRIKHNTCETMFSIIPTAFLQGQRCPTCSKKIHIEQMKLYLRKTHQKFLEEIYSLVGNEYLVLEKYNGSHTKILMNHNDINCNKNFYMRPSSFICGNRCPYCNISKGEEKIKNFLKNNNINYTQQYKFDNCKNKNSLPFDFAIFDKQNNLKLLIEYDGELHYKTVDRFGGKEKLKKQQFNDKIKTKYCKENNIPLLRIPYWDFSNLGDILKNNLNELIINKKFVI